MAPLQRTTIAVAVLLAVVAGGGEARAEDGDVLGPSTYWPSDEDEPLLRGPVFADASVVTMPPPRLSAVVTEGSSPEVTWWLNLDLTARAAARASFTIGPSGAELIVDGVPRGQVGGGTLALDVEAGVHRVVLRGVTRGRTLRARTGGATLDVPPIETRHLLLGGGSEVDHVQIGVVLPAASIVTGGASKVAATASVQIPERWSGADRSDHSAFPCVMRGHTESTYRCETEPPLLSAAPHGTVVASAGTTAKDVRLAVVVRSPLHRPVIIPGGPIVGFGAQLGDGFRMRLGYEVAVVSRRAMVQATVDTDYDRHAVAALTASTAWALGLVGVGVGVPVRVAPELATGARLQGDVFLGPVGFVASADVWLFAPERPHVTGTLLGVLSF
ncbi:MAG: hypothetical protein JWP97_1686 [Labilithrix sp.]|nr:hypothetical protein [Labilithrix sp.]